MIPFVVLAQTPFVTKGIGLSWTFPGVAKAEKERYALVGKTLSGEVFGFVAKGGHYDAQALYDADTQRTKEADAAKGFTHVRTTTTLAGMSAIESDQRYLWNGSPVASRCVYCAAGDHAWVVRLWWPKGTAGETAATAFLKTIKREKEETGKKKA